MAASEWPPFISLTLGRLTSLEQHAVRIGEVETELIVVSHSLGESNQKMADLDNMLNIRISVIFAAQGHNINSRGSCSKL